MKQLQSIPVVTDSDIGGAPAIIPNLTTMELNTWDMLTVGLTLRALARDNKMSPDVAERLERAGKAMVEAVRK